MDEESTGNKYWKHIWEGIKEVKCQQNENTKEHSMLGSFTISHRHINKKCSKKMTLYKRRHDYSESQTSNNFTPISI